MQTATRKKTTMRSVNQPSRNQPRTYSREQRAIQKEFCEVYGFKPEQVGFDGNSLDPIFDYDALCLLSIRLCDIPDIFTELASVDRLQGLAQSRCSLTLPGGAMRRVFATALMGEAMPDGEPIRDISQAISVSRARALRVGLRAVGFDPIKAHQTFKDSKGSQKLQLLPVDRRTAELAEIHMLAQALDWIVVGGDGFVNKTEYQRMMAVYFNGETSAKNMDDQHRSQWLTMLRSWAKAHDVAVRGRSARAV